MNGPLNKDSWQYRQINETAPGLSFFSDALIELVEEGKNLVVGTADLQYSNGLVRFANRYPDRFIQFGISEQNMVSAAAGIATTGPVPYVATFASFLALLCCEQIRMDVAYSALPVRLIGHHAGISLGFYGTSHHATEDLAIMRSIADIAVIAPADGPQLKLAIKATHDLDTPIYFRIGRGREPDVYDSETSEFEFGKAIEHFQGDDLTIIATGICVHPALQAARKLRDEGMSIGLVDMHTIKPLDKEKVLEIGQRSKIILTVEEHNIIGGLGGAVAEVLAENPTGARLVRHGIMDEYSLIAPPTHLYSHYRLDSDGIESVIHDIFQKI